TPARPLLLYCSESSQAAGEPANTLSHLCALCAPSANSAFFLRSGAHRMAGAVPLVAQHAPAQPVGDADAGGVDISPLVDFLAQAELVGDPPRGRVGAGAVDTD